MIQANVSGGVLIAGCGYIGNRLGLLLCADDRRVVGVRRRAQHIVPPIEALAFDLNQPGDHLTTIAPAISHLVFVATADQRNEKSYRRLYVDAFKAIRKALLDAGAPLERILYVSSTAVYAQCNAEWVNETSPTEPHNFNSKVLLEAEAVVQDSPIMACSVRFSGIYGINRYRLISQLRANKVPIDNFWRYTNRIHSDDCAAVLRHLLSLRSPHRLYLAVDNKPAPQGEVMHWLAQQIGSKPPLLMPTTPATTVNLGKRCSNARLLADGYQFRYPSYQEGYAMALKEAHGRALFSLC